MIRLNLFDQLRPLSWRRRVERLAREHYRKGPEEFREARCAHCGIALYVNVQIYPPADPVECDRCAHYPLYEPEVRTNGHGGDAYWYACCLNGVDPQGRHGTRISAVRQRELKQACDAVGLTFGSIVSD